MKKTKDLSLNKKIVKKNFRAQIIREDTTPIKDTELLALHKNVLEQPHNSENWIKMIAYYVDKGLLEDARKQAQKALVVITFTSEREKLNVWKSYLNLEFYYGDKDTLLDIYRQASSACGLEVVSQHLFSLFKAKASFEDGEIYVKDFIKRSKKRFEAWKLALDFYIAWKEREKRSEDTEEADERIKDILRRALQSLPPNKHIEFIAYYAKLDYQHKNFESARFNFENLLANFPRRNDIWSVYIEYEIKNTKDIEYIRALFDRVTSIKKNLKQIKFFFKRYLEFEQKFGDKQTQEEVKIKAKAFVENYNSQQPDQLENLDDLQENPEEI